MSVLVKRTRILIRGCVQGVGFRPTVYRLARAAGLVGFVCNNTSGVTIELQGKENKICQFLTQLQSDGKPPLAADIFGFDLLTVANEGKVVAVVSAESADTCLNICRNHPLGKKASIIGEIVEADGQPVVEIETQIGGRRVVQMPSGHQLPRIC